MAGLDESQRAFHLKRPHLALMLGFHVVRGKPESECGLGRGAKGLSVIPAFLHMSRDGPKPQALTQAAVPQPTAKIHCEEYSCSVSKSAPFRFIAGEHEVLRRKPCRPERQTSDSGHDRKHWSLR